MAVGWHMQQLGPRFRSNSAGDGPEKTRDRRFWFPRFKSTLLGSYRSKATFVLCECGLSPDEASVRSKTTNGHHCACGRDEWHMAKKVEENEYRIRLDVSKHYGGIRYDDALAQHSLDLDNYLAHRVQQLPCSTMPGGCPICADDERRLCGSLKGEDDELTPLPLKMDDRPMHWKDTTLVNEYLGCFLDSATDMKVDVDMDGSDHGVHCKVEPIHD
ncbi:unnamed protein product [Aphanomyces euteiches]|uniref:Uncharacterized protein n=1 Tax=Aphanomyces euteiches TaxID=100861 RepID=A0A6G0WDX9_9STRA|nr:hypothetical protein Ae201684_016835 [Aphanomyces euteiches]KAH9075969.1 hypothetical protein Ae201684P_012459 [Aphanomyces euteiches]KAH9088087.1 hypothetical protein LEN26_019688 [Aphanomyces euteiches]KAH9105258.1 hypothetical protein AeMF1_018867 [Aphanomyces euteiches]KAH9153656.1 hypothetical protein AeRB84_004138 [Aphanomyces euteiches]